MKNKTLFSYRENGVYLHHTRTENPSINEFAFQSHSHNMYEIYLFLEGEGDFAVEGNIIPLERGVIVFTVCGQTHNLLLKSEKTAYERVAILFSEKNLPFGFEELLSRASNGGCVAKLDDKGVEWFLNSLQILKYGIENNIDVKKLCISLITLSLGYLTQISDMAKTYDETDDDLVKQIIKYVDRNLCNKISLESLEKALYRDKAYLGRRFKEVMGCSIWEYIMRKRVFTAREQLYLTKNVGDAFALSGFGDYSTFYRRYKKYIGISPSEDLKNFIE